MIFSCLIKSLQWFISRRIKTTPHLSVQHYQLLAFTSTPPTHTLPGKANWTIPSSPINMSFLPLCLLLMFPLMCKHFLTFSYHTLDTLCIRLGTYCILSVLPRTKWRIRNLRRRMQYGQWWAERTLSQHLGIIKHIQSSLTTSPLPESPLQPLLAGWGLSHLCHPLQRHLYSALPESQLFGFMRPGTWLDTS